jgi:hypothetical protein
LPKEDVMTEPLITWVDLKVSDRIGAKLREVPKCP